MKTLDYDRYVFRLVKQGNGETIDSFVDRLRHQIKKCQFADEEAQMKDQIIEKGFDNELRKYAFENIVTLSQLILTGKTLEDAKRNSLRESSKNVAEKEVKELEKPQCTRCGQYNHKFYDKRCPALNNKCETCRKFGHYTKLCRWTLRQSSDGNSRNKRHAPVDSDTDRSSSGKDHKRPRSENEQSNLKTLDDPHLPSSSKETAGISCSQNKG